MSYKYETQYNSPNYTPKAQTRSVWGRDRIITAIAIHWWGDPNTNPTYEGVIATLCNPSRGASAHYVATGTGRRVACLVSPEDNSWATNSANPYTISIECDPRCRNEDYDVVAELIASIRSAYGDLPLVPHRQFVATQCPGNYSLEELDRRARTKDGSGDWGDVHDIVPPTPKATDDQIRAAYLEILERAADDGGINHYRAYTIGFVRQDLLNSQERKDLIARKEAEANQPPVVVPPVVVEPTPEVPVPTEPEEPTPVEPTPVPETPKNPWYVEFLNWVIAQILKFISPKINRIN